MAGYTETYINNDMSKLNTVLQTLVTNGIVGAVDYDDSGTYAVFTLYADAEKETEVFRITESAGKTPSAGDKKYTFQATASDGNTLSSTLAISTSNSVGIYSYKIMYGYSCENGVLIPVITNSGHGAFLGTPVAFLLITKNQNDVPVFVWTGNDAGNDDHDQNLTKVRLRTEYEVASSDVAPLSTFSRANVNNRRQNVLSPFVTCSATGEISYTPNAGRVVAGSMSEYLYDNQLNEVTFMNATWLTNGYWMLKV